jgi:hypothetical protein
MKIIYAGILHSRKLYTKQTMQNTKMLFEMLKKLNP